MALLLVEVAKTPTLDWLLPGLLVSVSILLERALPGTETTTNPVAFQTGVSSRQDPDLEEHLAFGRGAEGQPGRATFPEQHSRAYLLFRKQRAGAKALGLHLMQTRKLVLLRYLDCSQRYLARCKDYVVLTDATRLGGKEVQLFVVGGFDSSGALHLCWAPPQAKAPDARESIKEG